MDVKIAKKFGLVEVTCFSKSDVTIILKKPNGSVKIFLPDKKTKVQGPYTSYKPHSAYGVYGPYSAYSSYSGSSKVVRKGGVQFITFEPESRGVYELEVLNEDEKKLMRVEV